MVKENEENAHRYIDKDDAALLISKGPRPDELHGRHQVIMTVLFSQESCVHGRIVLVLILLLVCSLPAVARVELSVGRSETVQYDRTTVLFAEWVGEPRPAAWKLHWAPDVGLGHFSARHNLPGIRLDHDVWVGAVGGRLYLWRGAFFGFQGALTDGKTDALSTLYEFVSTLGWQWHHWQLMARHISNGDFHKPNHGETMLLVGVAF